MQIDTTPIHAGRPSEDFTHTQSLFRGPAQINLFRMRDGTVEAWSETRQGTHRANITKQSVFYPAVAAFTSATSV